MVGHGAASHPVSALPVPVARAGPDLSTPAAIDPPLAERRLCFVLGKGGVGKSTVSAALGVAYARAGHHTLLLEVSGRERLSRLVADAGASTSPTRVGEGLYAATIDPEQATEEYLRGQLHVRALADVLVHSRTFRTFSQAAPGLSEMVTLGKIWSFAVELRPGEEAPAWDRLVVDCPATGHGIALLETAKSVREIAREGPIHDQAERIREVISHPAATGVAVVARPDELPVSEALQAIVHLRSSGLPVAASVLNAATPERFSADDVDVLTRARSQANGSVRAAVEAALGEAERARLEAEHASDLARGGLPLVTLPRLTNDRAEGAGLERLADALFESLGLGVLVP